MKYVVVVSLILSALFARGQNFEPCHTNQYIDYLETQYPGIKAHMDEQYHKTLSGVKASQQHGKILPIDTTYVIKVVFHIVYRTPDQNLDDALIHEQMEVLNECFNRQNADTVNTRDIFKPIAGSARMRFELADVDPDGKATTGITRTQTSVTTFNTFNRGTSFDYVKQTSRGGVDAWDTDKYLNVWVCNLDFTNGRLGLFGYAYPPTGADFWQSNVFQPKERQGVVLHYEIVGRNNPASLPATTYTNEKTAVHEFGHFFGLRHIWGDGGCNVDDFIDDTPLASGATSGCPIGRNTCGLDNLPDQIENYMDYGSAACSNMFTEEQIRVIRYNVVNLRPGLATPEYVYPPVPEIGENHLYPNPVTDKLLRFFDENLIDVDVKLELTNMLGQPVLEQTAFKSDYIVEFNQIDLAAGMYYAVLTVNGEVMESGMFLIADK